MRLIDGDKLLRKMQKVATEAWKMKLKAPNVETVWNQAIDFVKQAPTIEERKTGRWANFAEYLKHLEETTGTKYDFYHQKYHDDFVFCSRCWQMKNRYENWKYCPDCGSYNGGNENDNH